MDREPTTREANTQVTSISFRGLSADISRLDQFIESLDHCSPLRAAFRTSSGKSEIAEFVLSLIATGDRSGFRQSGPVLWRNRRRHPSLAEMNPADFAHQIYGERVHPEVGMTFKDLLYADRPLYFALAKHLERHPEDVKKVQFLSAGDFVNNKVELISRSDWIGGIFGGKRVSRMARRTPKHS